MSTWHQAAPATETQLAALTSAVGASLPEAYVAYLRGSNGGEGDLGVEPGWVSLWPAETVCDNNDSYQVSKWLPGCFGFASNGGGELLAFDLRAAQPYPIVMVPFIGMCPEDAVQVAASFEEFQRAFGKPIESSHE
jgi:hypothetical protein